MTCKHGSDCFFMSRLIWIYCLILITLSLWRPGSICISALKTFLALMNGLAKTLSVTHIESSLLNALYQLKDVNDYPYPANILLSKNIAYNGFRAISFEVGFIFHRQVYNHKLQSYGLKIM